MEEKTLHNSEQCYVMKKLTNLDISQNYRDGEYWFMRSDFMGAFACWVVKQSPYAAPDISSPLSAFCGYLGFIFPDNLPKKFTYDELAKIIHEDTFGAIPGIMALNKPKVSTGNGYNNRHSEPHPDYDFIDLSALARNIFFMMLRESITQA